MKKKIAIILMCCLMWSVDLCFGQGYSLSLDHVDGAEGPDALATGVPVTFYIRLTNPDEPNQANVLGMTLAFRVYSPDGAAWEPITWLPYRDYSQEPHYVNYYPDWASDSMGGFFHWAEANGYGVSGTGADTVGFAFLLAPVCSGGFDDYSPRLRVVAPGFSEVVMTISTRVDPAYIGKTLCLDSCFFPPENKWLWAVDSGFLAEVLPHWDGPHCFTLVDCCLNARGNANNDNEDKANISDVSYILAFLFGIPTGPEPPCWEEGDVNADGKVNISDVTYFLDYLFGIPIGPEPKPCP